MTASVKILTTSTIDSSPAILLISPNGHKTLINCGEGCQRSFLESNADRVRSVNQVCLTHIGYSATGGLPGMILTSADAAQASVEERSGIVGGLNIIGPAGLKDYVHSLRHFMRRDRFVLTLREGEYESTAKAGDGTNSRHGKGKKRKKAGTTSGDSEDMGLFGITSLPMKREIKTFYGKEDIHISSYIFTTSPIAGKFQIQKARNLKIPPGPMYSKLKAGEAVTYVHLDSGEEVTVTADQVLEGGSEGVAIALVYCPDEYVFDQLCGSDNKPNSWIEKLNRYKSSDPSKAALELIIHYTSKKLFNSEGYKSWMREFGKEVEHMTIHPLVENTYCGGNEELDGSPFRSGVMDAMQRSLLEADIYPNPILSVDSTKFEEKSECDLCIHQARPQLEYIIMPLAKKGIDKNTLPSEENTIHGFSTIDHDTIVKETKASGALEAATKVVESLQDGGKGSIQHSQLEGQLSDPNGCLIFTGTGSAIPCKHRNVTGIYVGMEDQSGIILDAGEGTLGQLIRSWKSTYKGTNDSAGDFIKSRIKNTKAAWISHPHADHHLGIIRFLTERNSILLHSDNHRISDDDRIALIASPSLLRFLDEYSKVDPTIYYGYIPVDCRDTISDRENPVASFLNRELGITRCVSVPVSHCYHSYAVVLDGTSFGRLVYSGDCRPSDRLTEEGHGADILIHEATFENGMEEEAVLKMHSTVGEALSVAKRMNAKSCILTHFSQRYPRIPPLREEDSNLPFPVAFAFDFMRATPSNINIAANLTSALSLLFPENDLEDEEALEATKNEAKRKAQEILGEPGLFASKIQCN